jgi:DNA invertase Pin-like site-specific DNA recombinase
MQKNALYDLWRFKAGSSNWVSKDEWFFIDDGYSGKDLKRPAYERMMDMVRQKEFDMVVVWKIDRISRNLTHLLNVFEELQSRGVFFFSLKENIDFSGAIGKLTFQIFGALAEFERKTIMMRTTEGKIASARMGNFTKNTTPF